MEKKSDGMIPTFHIVAESIPQAHYRLLEKVHKEGYTIRTQYDRKDPVTGNYLDPPSKDAKVMIEIKNPFAQPRFSLLSYCERGKYIAEMLGVKDHLVVPYQELIKKLKSDEKFEPTQWPYSYHQRLAAYPKADGSIINQLERMVDDLANDPITRRAFAITSVPEIDLYIKGDQPCLREIQLRAIENKRGQLILNSDVRWRSRDAYKAWGDNLIGITNLLQIEIIPLLSEKTGREVIMGPYVESNGSLHIYGQDYTQKGMKTFFDTFPNEESFLKKCWTSEQTTPLIITELETLKNESTWKFPKKSIDLINNLIHDFEIGKFIP